jgi:hypothetical protein
MVQVFDHSCTRKDFWCPNTTDWFLSVQVQVQVLVSSSLLELMTRFLLLSDIWGFLVLGCPLWREDGSVIYLYSCFWALPEQSLSGPSPAELTTIFYCLIWDFPNLEGQVPVFISPRNRVVQLYPWALGFPLSQVQVILRPMVSWPVHLGVRHPSRF